MFDIVLYRPEIPPNTGNVIRLAANSGARLHLVRPLGFLLDDRHLARAGLDYGDIRDVVIHDDWSACRSALSGRRMFALSTRGTRSFGAASFAAGDVFVFGQETAGLPQEILDEFGTDCRLRVPMMPHVRSINLSNTVAIVVYEAWRQCGYAGATGLRTDGTA
ncbi:MAG: tRNA (cytidine(34)-2'-O)-methyltransferase [Betaproteobacteria bacterium]|nr:tRNA (cytidine(34)-2'-O)-methyltransferase [Betaproteobacteria bacterium]